MSIPIRNADPANIAAISRTFFATSSIDRKRNLLQSGRAAQMFIDVLYWYRSQRKYLLHAFVVMPDHFHVMVSVGPEMTIERAVQFIKGAFAFRAGKEFGFRAPVWQRGFSEVRIYSSEHFMRVLKYIEANPVKESLASCAKDYPYCSSYPGFEIDEAFQGLKPSSPALPSRHV